MESDSLELISLIHCQASIPAAIGSILDIFHCIPTFSAISFPHISRACKVAGHCLAKEGFNFISPLFGLEHCPSFLLEFNLISLGNCRGFTLYKLITTGLKKIKEERIE